MNLYRYKENGRLYTVEHLILDIHPVEHLILDIHHLNCNGFAGIYATPYKWDGDIIRYTKDGRTYGEPFEPEKFFQENFEKVAELRTL